MKKAIAMTTMALAGAMGVQAQDADYDSARVERLQEVVVSGVRAQKNAPFAVENIRKGDLSAHSKTGRELPFLFAQTPGVMAWSENGMGTGTTYMRIRGAGDSRINVTLDGVPLNSPEDQCVFWANMNSYGSLLGSVQIQRGVGTSTNGDGAFGGTIALSTATPLPTPSLEVSGSYGSYNTWNVGGNFSTGLLPLGVGHVVIDGAYHQTTTDGFIHGTGGRSGSYYGGVRWLGDNLVVSYKNIGNFEKTGQAWNGVTAGDNDLSLMDGTYGAATGIKTYKDMYEAGLGRYNTLYEALVYDADGNFAKGADGSYLTERYKMADGSYWDKTTDNFWQNHNLLTFSGEWGGHWAATATLHYTHGYGYYEEFRPQNKLSKFGLVATDAAGAGIKRADFVRKKGLWQDVAGLVGSISYRHERWDVVGGLSAQQFWGKHFGFLTYTSRPKLQNKDGGYLYKYYDSDASKLDGSAFVKATLHLGEQWDVFADLQYRHVDYTTDGRNDKYYTDAAGVLRAQMLDIDKKYDFLNPKAGVSWHRGGHHAYFSAALSHREPERNNFTDNGSYPAPKAEQLLDFELGYNYTADRWRVGANLYYMKYKDQFVQTGELNEIGEKLTTNISDSYRTGVELKAGVDPTSWLTIEGNAALSANRIKDFNEVVEDWDNGSQTIHYDNSTLAFSPSAIVNGFVHAHWRGLQATWHTNFVSRQYLDNTACKDRSLPAYTVSSVALGYTLPCKRRLGLRDVTFSLNLNNVFNQRYAASGWVYSAIYESGGHPNDNRYYQIGFVPMAGFTMMGGVTLRF